MADDSRTTNPKPPATALILPDGSRVSPGLVEELSDIFDIIRKHRDPEIRLVPSAPGRHPRTKRPVSPGLLWRLHPRLREPESPDGFQALVKARTAPNRRLLAAAKKARTALSESADEGQRREALVAVEDAIERADSS